MNVINEYSDKLYCTFTYIKQVQIFKQYLAFTRVRSLAGLSKAFVVKVGGHQGSALSPLLFNLMDYVTKDIPSPLSWTLLYADDIVLATNTAIYLQELLNTCPGKVRHKSQQKQDRVFEMPWGISNNNT